MTEVEYWKGLVGAGCALGINATTRANELGYSFALRVRLREESVSGLAPRHGGVTAPAVRHIIHEGGNALGRREERHSTVAGNELGAAGPGFARELPGRHATHYPPPSIHPNPLVTVSLVVRAGEQAAAFVRVCGGNSGARVSRHWQRKLRNGPRKSARQNDVGHNASIRALVKRAAGLRLLGLCRTLCGDAAVLRRWPTERCASPPPCPPFSLRQEWESVVAGTSLPS